MLSPAATALIVAMVSGTSTASPTVWDTLSQAQLESAADVSVSSSGRWYVYTVTNATGDRGNLTASTKVVVGLVNGGVIQTFEGFSAPKFSPDVSQLAMMSGGKLYTSSNGGKEFKTPTIVDLSGKGTPVYFDWSPKSNKLAVSVTPQADPLPTVSREIVNEVIINVITGQPTAPLNKLCIVELASGNITCPSGLAGSVGFGGWYISCWPYDSQFDWLPSGEVIAYTYTETTLSNEWTKAGVALYSIEANESTVISYNTSFQPQFSPDGSMIAFVQADSGDYVWAQTWHVCVYHVDTSKFDCEEQGTRDQMPTLIGWYGDYLVYTEQVSVEMKLFALPVSSTDGFGTYFPLNFQFSDPSYTGPGVIGGGFRATSRATLSSSSAGAMIGLTYEQPTKAQQAFIGTIPDKLDNTSTIPLTQVSQMSVASTEHDFLDIQVVNWTSDDGTTIEGLLTVPKGDPQNKPRPLVAFTHCGPAMAVMATFTGYGSVCARFPLATLAEMGYAVLQPNYRGSTGYGSDYRRLDKGDWGGNDYNDIMSGIKSMINAGVADPNRIAHIGWSYGGYMSALAMGKAKTTHNITLKAIVTGGTLSDLISHTGTTDISKIIDSWAGGYFWSSQENLQMMMDHSGMYHIANASTPTLMFHGIDDPRMPISQSFQLHYALLTRGIPVKFLTFPGSGHIPSDPNQIIEVWDNTISWLTMYNPVKPPHVD